MEQYGFLQMQNRMTEIIINGKVRKAQVAMRNKHGNSAKNNHHVKHRQSDHSHSQDQHHIHISSKVTNVMCAFFVKLETSLSICFTVNAIQSQPLKIFQFTGLLFHHQF